MSSNKYLRLTSHRHTPGSCEGLGQEVIITTIARLSKGKGTYMQLGCPEHNTDPHRGKLQENDTVSQIGKDATVCISRRASNEDLRRLHIDNLRIL